MKGFIKVAAAVPEVKVGAPEINARNIVRLAREMEHEHVALAVFPELCITAYTCADLFHNTTLLDAALQGLKHVCDELKDCDITVVVGLPLLHANALYNVGAVVQKGHVVALIPKTYVPNYNEFYEKRWWVSGAGVDAEVRIKGDVCRLTTRQLCAVNNVLFAVEICEDLWTPVPPSSHAVLAGADIVVNLSASDALIGKYDYVRGLVAGQSARTIAGYVYASAGFGESSTDLVFDGISLIASNGRIMAEGKRWQNEGHYSTAYIDVAALRHDRLTMSSFHDCAALNNACGFTTPSVCGLPASDDFDGFVDALPFVPRNPKDMNERCAEIINIQTAGLAQRLVATGTKNAVIGISGGLDSTLALLVTVKTFDRLGLPRKGIHAVTMPGFGTTDRTYGNAVNLIKELGASFREINISAAVRQHFSDIGHDESRHDVTYENGQARQRTLILMDIANQVGGMVVGTGDLSELALGWATYNGDHMSMYGVNAGVPKTLVKHLVSHFADNGIGSTGEVSTSLGALLRDIVDTPVSPELLPADSDGNIAQKTEDLVGPYELHDFFLYYTLRYGFGPDMIFERACRAFAEKYDEATILCWLKTFVRRFFAQQFKRSCLPDGPKVGSVCLSPRGDWRMPSDASSSAWLKAIDEIETKLKY